MQVPSGPAGEGSGRPREPDSAAVKGECKVNSGGQRWAKSTVHPPFPLDAEAALVDLCWIPFGIQSHSAGLCTSTMMAAVSPSPVHSRSPTGMVGRTRSEMACPLPWLLTH